MLEALSVCLHFGLECLLRNYYFCGLPTVCLHRVNVKVKSESEINAACMHIWAGEKGRSDSLFSLRRTEKHGRNKIPCEGGL